MTSTVYQDLLARSPQSSELNTWLMFLSTHTRGALAQTILTSVEYQSDIIQSWYQRYLDRAANGSEVSAARFTLTGGGTDEDVIAGLIGSLEYFARSGLCRHYVPLVRR